MVPILYVYILIEDNFFENFNKKSHVQVKSKAIDFYSTQKYNTHDVQKTYDLDQQETITVELNEDKSVCLDDMETKLCLLFKKILVYSSKLELLKLKAYKKSGEQKVYSMFRKYCDPSHGTLSAEKLDEMLSLLELPLSEQTITNFILFLEKYTEKDEDSPLELIYPDFRQLFISHKVMTNETFLFSDWTENQMHKENINLENEEFYLFRQIILLTDKQILDIKRIIYTLKAYKAESLFDYILLFSPDQKAEQKKNFKPKINFESERVKFQQHKRQNVSTQDIKHHSFSNNQQVLTQSVDQGFDHFEQEDESPYQTQTMKSSLIPNRSLLQNHMRASTPRRNRKFADDNAFENHFELQNDAYDEYEDNIEIKQNLNYSKVEEENDLHDKSINVDTLRNFLNFHGVMFLEEDIELVMNYFGNTDGNLIFQEFSNFFYSSLWEPFE